MLPAATAPPLATAAVDIMPEAMEPTAMPAEVKPMAPRTKGAPTTPATAHRQQFVVSYSVILRQGHFKMDNAFTIKLLKSVGIINTVHS